MGLQETRMISKALTQRWPIKPEYRAGLITQMMKVIADPNTSPREKTAAAKAILAAEKQNQDDEHKIIDISIQARNLELDELAADLGVEISVIENAEAESGISDLRVEADELKARRPQQGH